MVTAKLREPTCLFTGEPLTPQTDEEHTLLRALGGRICSRLVSSNNFNHRSGESVDRVLFSVYAVLMNQLDPLLSSEHRQGCPTVSVPGEPPGLVLEQGALTRRNCAILSRDERGKPKTAIAADVGQLERLARQLGAETQCQISSAPASQSDSFFHDCPLIGPEIEVAALKACLLTFDHLLQDDPNRFTRSAALAPVREFVRKGVIEGVIDPELCHRFSLGMQYERLARYRQMRNAIPFAETPFEHVLLAAGYGPERCIDVVWIVFGFDPFGFRITDTWDGGPFAFGIVNGVLKDSGFTKAVPLVAPDDLLCRPTKLRSCSIGSVPAQSAADVQEIVSHRCAAGKEAMYLVDMQAPGALRYNLVQSALCDPPHQRSVGAQILKRLQARYARIVDAPQLRRALARVLRRNTPGAMKPILRQRIEDESAEAVNWPAALSIYRACLVDLRAQFGLPEVVVAQEMRVRAG